MFVAFFFLLSNKCFVNKPLKCAFYKSIFRSSFFNVMHLQNDHYLDLKLGKATNDNVWCLFSFEPKKKVNKGTFLTWFRNKKTFMLLNSRCNVKGRVIIEIISSIYVECPRSDYIFGATIYKIKFRYCYI